MLYRILLFCFVPSLYSTFCTVRGAHALSRTHKLHILEKKKNYWHFVKFKAHCCIEMVTKPALFLLLLYELFRISVFLLSLCLHRLWTTAASRHRPNVCVYCVWYICYIMIFAFEKWSSKCLTKLYGLPLVQCPPTNEDRVFSQLQKALRDLIKRVWGGIFKRAQIATCFLKCTILWKNDGYLVCFDLRLKHYQRAFQS